VPPRPDIRFLEPSAPSQCIEQLYKVPLALPLWPNFQQFVVEQAQLLAVCCERSRRPSEWVWHHYADSALAPMCRSVPEKPPSFFPNPATDNSGCSIDTCPCRSDRHNQGEHHEQGYQR